MIYYVIPSPSLSPSFRRGVFFFLSKGNVDFYFVVTSRARVGSDRFVTGTRV